MTPASSPLDVTRIGDGMYRVVVNGRSEVVWATAGAGARWAFWNGRVFRFGHDERPRARPSRSGIDTHQSLTAPMPATVLKVLVTPGSSVRKGDTLMILEAMKMELPVRADADGTVRAVSVQQGELVPAGAPLVELE
jgi:biotin carboxyl carrier protein